MHIPNHRALAARGAAILQQSNLFRGTNRIALIGGGTLLFVGAIALVASRGTVDGPRQSRATAPVLDSLPGATETNEFQRRLLAEAEARRAQEETAAGRGYAASIAGRVPVKTDPAPQTPAATPAPATAPQTAAQAPTITYATNPLQMPINGQRAETTTPQNPQEDTNRETALRAQMLALMGSWGPKAPAYAAEITPEMLDKRRQDQDAAQAQPVAARTAASSPIGGSLGGADSPARGTVVMPALHWSMAKTVTATDSTGGGGLVVVKMTGGPLRDARLRGTAQRSGADRLAVTLNSMSWRGQTTPVSAVLISPETRETKIASEVNNHYGARLLYPALAAAVSAAGQAVALGGSTSSNGLLGSTSTLRQLDAGEIGAVAAGGAANDLRQILAEMAPRGPTVSLHADEPVGVMFLEDVLDQ